MSCCKKIIAIPEYVFKAANSDIDWFFECLSKLNQDLCCSVAGEIGLETKLSKNDVMDMVVLDKYVRSILKKENIDLCSPAEEKVFSDLREFSIQSLAPDITMSSMKNMNPWRFESRGDILFIILQDIFIGFMVKGDDSTTIRFLISTLEAYKRYYGEEALIDTPFFKRFIGLVI